RMLPHGFSDLSLSWPIPPSPVDRSLFVFLRAILPKISTAMFFLNYSHLFSKSQQVKGNDAVFTVFSEICNIRM
ncbi:MAG: hypothetical protein LUH53_04825, partial [Lachnospiraceae bacterium]|nr:hypothetical protein [Lachnospiraceae bacterium]